jgi:hypothetical protein
MSELLQKYQDVVNNPPKAGDILATIDGAPAILDVQTEEGKPPFIYGRAYVSEILNSSLGWYLHGDTGRSLGWKCVLMTKARREALKKCQVVDDKIKVVALRVIRPSESGKALLCEVHKYLPEMPNEELAT